MLRPTWVLTAVVLASGCVQSNAVVCDNGALCPAGSMCTPEGRCQRPEQLVVCQDVPEGNNCDIEGKQGT